MTDKELRRLKREELLEMLIEVSKENEKLREMLIASEKELKSREIKISNAGSIAEASLALNGVFEAAEKACVQYAENIERMNKESEKILAQAREEAEMTVEQAKDAANKIIRDAISRKTDKDG